MYIVLKMLGIVMGLSSRECVKRHIAYWFTIKKKKVMRSVREKLFYNLLFSTPFSSKVDLCFSFHLVGYCLFLSYMSGV